MKSTDAPLGTLVKAVAFAADKHSNQRRENAEALPYINHPIALANVLANEGGVEDATVLCAAVLHDTIEDTETTSEELQAIFGPKVASVVMDMTDDKSLEKSLRKQRQVEHAPHISKEAKLVKLADKISNLRDIIASSPADWSADRKRDFSIGPPEWWQGCEARILRWKQFLTGCMVVSQNCI